ncbi:hypothetical protein Q7A53_09075 [Halobacillus rhizosphaerae]|uniref:hypothetical protein n=1 Tax=Halobacillus rhizosphaerae TaxID=3064889 RepID=UPI00398A92DB
MYCEKLKDILNNDAKNELNETIVRKLDHHLKDSTTLLERKKLNPVSFSIHENVNPRKAYRLFLIGSKVGLFIPHALYRCECGDQFKVNKGYKTKYYCECSEKAIVPAQDHYRIFLYFELVCSIEECFNFDPTDVVSEKEMEEILGIETSGKDPWSLGEINDELGDEDATDLLNQRVQKKLNYIDKYS